MSLWIRSQDKELLMNCNAVGIGLEDDKSIYSNGYVLGTYSTKEKALKVLDMIEKALTKTINIENVELSELEILKEELKQNRTISTMPLEDLEYKIHNREFVFQMPLDTEVEE